MTHSQFVSVAALIGALLVAATGAVVAQAQERRPGIIGGGEVAPARPAPKPHDFDKWEKEIAAFEAADKSNPSRRGGILFIGSSTIRMWKTLDQDFPDRNILNRGFGGSEIADSTHFIPRIVFPYAPKQIFLRAGGNDIHNARPPEEVAMDFAVFVRKVRERLPDTEIVYISFNPAPSRWGENDKLQLLNTMIRKLMRRTGLEPFASYWVQKDRDVLKSWSRLFRGYFSHSFMMLARPVPAGQRESAGSTPIEVSAAGAR